VTLLRKERTTKAQEFSEAREHISRLMNIVGHKHPSDQATERIQRQPLKSKPALHAKVQPEISLKAHADGLFFQSASSVQGAKQLSLSIDEGSSWWQNEMGSPLSMSGISPHDEQARKQMRPLMQINRNSPTKPSQNSLKGSGLENQPDSLNSQAEIDSESCALEDTEWGFEDEDYVISTPS
jgi:hypothetical protein